MQKTNNINVTDRVLIGAIDDELCPLLECICGHEFEPWTHLLSIYDEPSLISACPNCGVKLFFRIRPTVFKIVDEQGNNV